jgi:hypothetical protein
MVEYLGDAKVTDVRDKVFVDKNVGLHVSGLRFEGRHLINDPHRFKVSVNNAMVMKILEPRYYTKHLFRPSISLSIAKFYSNECITMSGRSAPGFFLRNASISPS